MLCTGCEGSRGIGRGLSDHHVALCKVWYREGYTRSLMGKRVEWDRENNGKHMWEQVKRTMVGNEREVCGVTER